MTFRGKKIRKAYNHPFLETFTELGYVFTHSVPVYPWYLFSLAWTLPAPIHRDLFRTSIARFYAMRDREKLF